jgi:diphthamide biosynthesis protein 3
VAGRRMPVATSKQQCPRPMPQPPGVTQIHPFTMGAYYDEIEIEDMSWDEEKGVYHYPCPCGDRFEISRKQLANYEDIATCPSCSLIICIVYDPVRKLSSNVVEPIFIDRFRPIFDSSISKMNRQTMRHSQRKMRRSLTRTEITLRMPSTSSRSTRNPSLP